MNDFSQTPDNIKQNVQLAKNAYAKYLQLLAQLSEEEKAALDHEVKSLESQKINQVKQSIQSLNVE